MHYKRKSYFRYTFKEPLSAFFQISTVDSKPVHTSDGEATLENISPEGAKLTSVLNIPEINDKTIELTISFHLNDKEFKFNGKIVWRKQLGNTYNYGIEFSEDESAKSRLIEQLKIYSKKVKQI